MQLIQLTPANGFYGPLVVRNFDEFDVEQVGFERNMHLFSTKDFAAFL